MRARRRAAALWHDPTVRSLRGPSLRLGGGAATLPRAVRPEAHERPTTRTASPRSTPSCARTRVFPPPRGVQPPCARRGPEAYDELYRALGGGPRGLLGRAGRAKLHWAKPLEQGPRLAAAVREVVRRRQDQRLRQLPRPPPATARGEQGGDHLGGRAGRHARAHLPGAAPRGLPLRQRAQEARRARPATASPSTCRWSPRLAIAMLACARIGATHTVVFGGFSAEALARPHQRRRGEGRRSPPTAATAAASVVPLKANVDEALAARARRVEARGRRAAAPAQRGRRCTQGRDHWWHELMARRVRRTARPSRSTASTRSSSSTPPARPASRRASCTPPAATSVHAT